MQFTMTHKFACGQNMGIFRCGFINRSRNVQQILSTQYAMNYVHQGTGVFQQDGDPKKYSVKRGSVIRRFPNIGSSLQWNSSYIIGVVAVPAQVFDVLKLSGVFRSDDPVFQIPPDDSLNQQFYDLGTALESNSETDFSDVMLGMIALMIDLHKREDVSASQSADPVIAQAMAILGADLDMRLPIPQVAADLNIGYSKFRKLFRSYAGMSPGDYRIQRRIEASLNMLMDPKYRIGDVAENLGYPDIYSFSLQFKKIMGMSPQRWRNMVVR